MAIDISVTRLDYIKRLISGVRKEASKHMEKEHADILEKYPESTCGHVLDSILLCDVIEKEVFGIEDSESIEEEVNH